MHVADIALHINWHQKVPEKQTRLCDEMRQHSELVELVADAEPIALIFVRLSRNYQWMDVYVGSSSKRAPDCIQMQLPDICLLCRKEHRFSPLSSSSA
jgi:hypothetical protein